MHRAGALWWLVTAACLLMAAANSASAEELITTLATGDTWIAESHARSLADPPDVCIAFESSKGLLFYAKGDDYQIRVIDESWSLPPEVQADLRIRVAGADILRNITDNNDSTVSIQITRNNLEFLLDQCQIASTIFIDIGKENRNVPLAGAAKPLNAFRVCAGLPPSRHGGQPNPFGP